MAIVAVAGCSLAAVAAGGDDRATSGTGHVAVHSTAAARRAVEVPAVNPQRITPLVPGQAKVVTEAIPVGRKIALTFDDGICAACVKRIIDVLQQTGAHASLFPNGVYASS